MSTVKSELVKGLPSGSSTGTAAFDLTSVIRNAEHFDEGDIAVRCSDYSRRVSVASGSGEKREMSPTERDENGRRVSDRHQTNYLKGIPVILLRPERKIEDRGSHSLLLEDKGFSRSTHLGVIYGTLLVLFGLTLPVSEALQNVWMTSHVVAVFMTYLFAGAAIFILYLEIYEAILKKRQTTTQRAKGGQLGGVDNPSLDLAEREQTDDVEVINNNNDKEADKQCLTVCSQPEAVVEATLDTCVEGESSSPTTSGVQQAVDDVNQSEMKQNAGEDSTPSIYSMDSDVRDDVYDYITMHHGTATMVSEDTNYFVKIGLLVFAIANLVLVALRIEGDNQINKCNVVTRIVYPHYVHLAFIILQTFLLTKTCKYSLRKRKAFVNFGLMHLVATNLCVWLRYLVAEVVENVHRDEEYVGGNYVGVSYSDDNTTNSCTTETMMDLAGNYLFPFVLEYSLIAMTAIISVYSNINIRLTGELYRSICESLHKQRVARAKGDDPRSSHHLQDGNSSGLEKSHRGLMVGLVVLAGVIVSIVLFFYWKTRGDTTKAEMCHDISELIILTLFVTSTIAGMCQLYHFIFNPSNKNTLDHALLLIAANFLLVLELFTIISKITYITEDNDDYNIKMELVSSVMTMMQGILQVAFITDGMQRVSVKDKDIKEKTGREVITFLMILNAIMWLFESFQEKYTDQLEEIHMYGDLAWAIISSVSHPLQVFFYFHSAVCLAHMWHHCYKHAEKNIITNSAIL